MKTIKTAILIDQAGSDFGATSPQEEQENLADSYQTFLAPHQLAWTSVLNTDRIPLGTKLVLFDYGGAGAMGASGLSESMCRDMIHWAEDHSKALVIVTSTYTWNHYMKYVAEEMDKELKNLPNVVLADYSDHCGELFPKWWLIEHDLLPLAGQSDNPVLPEPIQESAPEPEPAKPEAAYCGTWVRSGCENPITCEACQTCKEHCECKAEVTAMKVDSPQREANRPARELPPVVAHINVPVRLDWEPGQRSGFARFKFADCLAEVTDDTTGKRIATIGGAMGGVYECNIPDGKGNLWSYSLRPQDLWPMFEAMHKQRLAEASQS